MRRFAWKRVAALGGAALLGSAAAAFTGSLLMPETAERAPASGFAPPVGEGPEAWPDAGPRAALVMVDRLALFRAGDLGPRLVLESPELTALLRHAVPGLVPDGVSGPEVRVVGSVVLVRARVSPQALPGGAHLGAARAALPDPVAVELRGRIRQTGPDRVAYRIDRAEVEGIPLPPSVLARLVTAWPGGAAEGPPDAPRASVSVRWPFADTRVLVADDVVVLEQVEPILAESVDGSDGV